MKKSSQLASIQIHPKIRVKKRRSETSGGQKRNFSRVCTRVEYIYPEIFLLSCGLRPTASDVSIKHPLPLFSPLPADSGEDDVESFRSHASVLRKTHEIPVFTNFLGCIRHCRMANTRRKERNKVTSFLEEGDRGCM